MTHKWACRKEKRIPAICFQDGERHLPTLLSLQSRTTELGRKEEDGPIF